MLLTVNIGNTNTAFGVFDGTQLIRHGRVPSEEPHRLPDAIGEGRFNPIALASVAPSRTDQVIPLLALRYNAPILLAGRDLPFGIEIQCDEPQEVGADRILNAVAACTRTGTATIIVDTGSAVTVDFVSSRGSFCGGAIAPGPEMMLRALHEHTELLPERSFSLEKPASPLGHSTADAMRSGAYWGTVGLVERLIAQIAADQNVEPRVIVTGGAGAFVAAEMSIRSELVPTLTLEGLAIVAEAATR